MAETHFSTSGGHPLGRQVFEGAEQQVVGGRAVDLCHLAQVFLDLADRARGGGAALAQQLQAVELFVDAGAAVGKALELLLQRTAFGAVFLDCGQRHFQAAQLAEVEKGEEVLLGVEAVAVGLIHPGGEEAAALVVAQRVHADAGEAGKFANFKEHFFVTFT